MLCNGSKFQEHTPCQTGHTTVSYAKGDFSGALSMFESGPVLTPCEQSQRVRHKFRTRKSGGSVNQCKRCTVT